MKNYYCKSATTKSKHFSSLADMLNYCCRKKIMLELYHTQLGYIGRANAYLMSKHGERDKIHEYHSSLKKVA